MHLAVCLRECSLNFRVARYSRANSYAIEEMEGYVALLRGVFPSVELISVFQNWWPSWVAVDRK